MIIPKAYKFLKQNSFIKNEFSIVPIRYEDRFKIMEWRNEQMYHLRQSSLLTKEGQENYFNNVVANLFEQEKPDQILFSYLQDGICIGYGGLVHINWIDRNAEISFIMKTELEEKEFKKHWGNYLDLLEELAFKELNLHKLFTYAFDLRPYLYEAIEAKGYTQEAVLKDHCFFEGLYKDVIIHSKINQSISVRKINDGDKQITFEWANDPITRKNSFNSEPIIYEQHSKWFDTKINDITAHHYVCEINNKPAGLVRFDLDENENVFIVGLTIAESFRGKKLATTFLKKACAAFTDSYNEHIIAYIKEDNIASKKVFENAGFRVMSKANIQGTNSVKYAF
ncbi:MAG: GNAT family N-acetyltransferase [Paludibacter sp.]|nr:GNAT family N-acetyltransferase [Paludibacter sp.]